MTQIPLASKPLFWYIFRYFFLHRFVLRTNAIKSVGNHSFHHLLGDSLMKHIVTIVLLTALAVSATQALPRYALATGAKCVACHVNPTGGQLRTEYGTSYSANTLVMETTHKKSDEKTEVAADSTAEVTPAEEDFTFNPRLTENITIGGD